MNSEARETPKAAASRLAAPAIRKGFKPEALHVYTSEKGALLYCRIRAKHPATGDKWIRPMSWGGQSFVLGEPQFQNGKPLYHLHELATRCDEEVFVTEGEWCADSLAKLGLLTTTTGAADSAAKADWSPLANRRVVIWPDNDEAGQRYAASVAAQVQGVGCTVRLVDVVTLGLPPKGDAVDWLAANPGATKDSVLSFFLTVGKLATNICAATLGPPTRFTLSARNALLPCGPNRAVSDRLRSP